MADHDWHLFDIERGYEVRRDGDVWLIRVQHSPNDVTKLTDAEFDQLRRSGASPKGLT